MSAYGPGPMSLRNVSKQVDANTRALATLLIVVGEQAKAIIELKEQLKALAPQHLHGPGGYWNPDPVVGVPYSHDHSEYFPKETS